MTHSIHVDYACRYGVCEAVLLTHIQYITAMSRRNQAHYFNGYYWAPTTYEKLARRYSYLTLQQVRRALDSLVKQGAIFRCHLPHTMDRTSFYTVCDIPPSSGKLHYYCPEEAKAFGVPAALVMSLLKGSKQTSTAIIKQQPYLTERQVKYIKKTIRTKTTNEAAPALQPEKRTKTTNAIALFVPTEKDKNNKCENIEVLPAKRTKTTNGEGQNQQMERTKTTNALENNSIYTSYLEIEPLDGTCFSKNFTEKNFEEPAGVGDFENQVVKYVEFREEKEKISAQKEKEPLWIALTEMFARVSTNLMPEVISKEVRKLLNKYPDTDPFKFPGRAASLVNTWVSRMTDAEQLGLDKNSPYVKANGTLGTSAARWFALQNW